MNLQRFSRTITATTLLFWLGSAVAEGVLNPQGSIAHEQRRLLFDTVSLMLIVVLPVIVMSFAFAHRFRESKHLGEYKPEWCHNTLLEVFWWGIPSIIILILAVVTWHKTHELDPYRPLAVKGEPELIEVVALRWKWLFIYPKEGIASINDLYLPVNRQVKFHITADAPMSSFDIPQLGGQIYAMAGMRTKLHLFSKNLGTYEGLNTQLNGIGFSHMHFPAHVVTTEQFSTWVTHTKTSAKPLTIKAYSQLYLPKIAAPAQYFSAVPNNLFNKIMQQYTQQNQLLHPLN